MTWDFQCSYKRKVSVKATRASLCYTEPWLLYDFAHFSQITPNLQWLYIWFCSFEVDAKQFPDISQRNWFPLGLCHFWASKASWVSLAFGPPSLEIPGPLGLHFLSGHMGLLGLLNWSLSRRPWTLRRPRRPMCPESEPPLSFQKLFTEKVFTYWHRHYSLAQVASLSAGQRETWLSRLFEGKFLWKINLDKSR